MIYVIKEAKNSLDLEMLDMYLIHELYAIYNWRSCGKSHDTPSKMERRRGMTSLEMLIL